MRFCTNCKLPNDRKVGLLTTLELEMAKCLIVKHVHREAFGPELQQLKETGKVKSLFGRESNNTSRRQNQKR